MLYLLFQIIKISFVKIIFDYITMIPIEAPFRPLINSPLTTVKLIFDPNRITSDITNILLIHDHVSDH